MDRRAARSRGGHERHHRSPLDSWVDRLFVVVVAGSLLAIGSVHVPVLIGVSVLAVGCGILAMYAHSARTGTWPIGIPAVGIAGMTLWTMVQVIPLPSRLLARIAEKNADVWAYALSPLGEAGPRWVTISLAPGATWVEALKGLTYFGVVVAATSIASRRGAAFGVATVFLSGLAAGVVTLLHGLTGMTRVYGLYEPLHEFARWAIGPLLNSNHLAGYLNLAAMCGLGLLLMRKPFLPRIAVGIAVATMVGLTISTASRGAVVLLPVGVGLTVLLLRIRENKHRGKVLSPRVLSVLTATAGAGGLLLAVLGMTTDQWKSLLDNDLSKLNILDWARPMMGDYRWFGVGRGAFETVYPAYRPVPGHMLWTHPENIVVQWVTEWGIPVALAAAVFFAWLIRPARVGATRSAVVAGAWAGLVILVLQNWVDFSLEIPSVAIAAVAILGSFWGDVARRGAETRGKNETPPSRWRLWADRIAASSLRGWGWNAAPVALGAFWTVALLASIGLGMPTAAQLRERVKDEITATPPLPIAAFREGYRTALLRFPADPYFPLAGALRAYRARDDNPVPYVQRALERSMVYGRAHLLMADILFGKGFRNQALLELKKACTDDPVVMSNAIHRAVDHTTQYEDLVRMVPDGEYGVDVMDALAGWLHHRNPDSARRFDDEILKRDALRVAPRRRALADLIAQIELAEKGTRCATENTLRACVDDADRRIRELEPFLTGTAEAATLRARLYLRTGRVEDASRLLAHACENVPDRMDCLCVRLEVESHREDHGQVDEVVQQIVATGCRDVHHCADTWRWVGSFAERSGQLGRAVTAYEKATQQEPGNADLWIALGRAASTLGRHGRAARAYERAAEIRRDDPLLTALAEKERALALGMPGLASSPTK